MTDCPRVSIVIPNWNTRRWLPGCFAGLQAQTFRDFDVIVVDNGSTDDSLAWLQRHQPGVRLIAFAENRGFAAAVNAGIKAARGEYVVLLNTDTQARPEWLARLVAAMDEAGPQVGSVASRMLSLPRPEFIDDAGDTLSWYGTARKRGAGEPAAHYNQPAEIFSACAGAALYRREFLAEVGYFDESFHSYLEDIDLGLRGQLYGYRCRYVPGAEILHQGHGAGIPRPRYVYLMSRNRLILLLKHIPWRLLFKHRFKLAYGQVYYFLVYKRPLYSLAGWLAFALSLPRVLLQRRRIQARRRLSPAALDGLLRAEFDEMPLGEIVRNRLGF